MKAKLRKSAALRGLKSDLRSLQRRYFSTSRKAVAAYLSSAAHPALHLGASENHIPGWLDSDVEPAGPGTIYLDASETFPMPDNSFVYIYAEHMIEHLDRLSGRRMLAECRRVLRPGGVLRLTTPDLSFILSLYKAPHGDRAAYLAWIAARFLRDPAATQGGTVINHMFRAWGHQFLYDESMLTAALQEAGFVHVDRVNYNESAYPALRGIERHGQNVGNEPMVRLETMLFEAS